MRKNRYGKMTSRPPLRLLGVCLLMVIWLAAGLAPAAVPPPATTAPETQAAPVTVDRQVLEEVVNKALERELTPVREMLTELTVRQVSLPDILGGIGYILGFFGVWAYFLSKRKKDS